MAETKTYTGGCHCGAVRYEVTADLAQVISCNCSICTKKGLLLTFVLGPAFKQLSGENDMKEYLFGKKRIHHQVCPTCGVEPFAHGVAPGGKPVVAINVRCLEGVDIGSLTPKPFNGRDL